MKRFIVTILSILYLAGATHATVHIHYCMGKLMGASMGYDDADKCGTCGMKKKKSCCKDEHATFKTAEHQLTGVSFELGEVVAAILLPVVYRTQHDSFYFATAAHTLKAGSAPPDIAACPIYIQVQNFRI